MAILTTGLIENLEISGVRPSLSLSLRMTNNDSVNASIQIKGFYLKGTTRTEYVFDIITVAPGGIAESNHYAQFDGFEFRFITISDGVEISAWGKDAAGNLSLAYPVVPAELFPLDAEGVIGANGLTTPSDVNQIYVANSSSSTVSNIDGRTNTLKSTVKVGLGPYGVGVNPTMDRIYVANSGSNNVSVIDGSSNTIITTVTVGTNPKGIGVNPVTNRIYVTNQGSNNVSVIDGLSHVVVATITVGASPEGVNVNSATNRVYVANHGSNNVSVINCTINTVIATVETGS